MNFCLLPHFATIKKRQRMRQDKKCLHSKDQQQQQQQPWEEKPGRKKKKKKKKNHHHQKTKRKRKKANRRGKNTGAKNKNQLSGTKVMYIKTHHTSHTDTHFSLTK